MQEIVPSERIESKIFLIRGLNVILDKDIAELYGVKPIALRQQVKRNKDRFPDDFIFKLTGEEAEILVSQNVIPSKSVNQYSSVVSKYFSLRTLRPLREILSIVHAELAENAEKDN